MDAFKDDKNQLMKKSLFQIGMFEKLVYFPPCLLPIAQPAQPNLYNWNVCQLQKA